MWTAFTASLTTAGATVVSDDGALTVGGLASQQIGDLAFRDGLRIYELTPVTASLEDAFMELTQDEVEYRPSTMSGAVRRRTRSVTMTTEIQLGVPRGHYRPKHIARSELAKIVTLRSTAITVGLTVVACLLVTGLATHAALHHGPGFYQGFDPTQESLTGMITVALTGGVFGALLITGEYSSGTIRTTMAAVPKRALLLATKLGLTTVLTMVFCVVLSFALVLPRTGHPLQRRGPHRDPGIVGRRPGGDHDRSVHRSHRAHVLRVRAHLP